MRRAEVRQTRGGVALRGRQSTDSHIRFLSPLSAFAVGGERTTDLRSGDETSKPALEAV